MKTWALVAASLFLSAAQAADTRPYWSFEAKGGRFTSELDDWSTYYGDDDSEFLALAVAFKALRFTDIGIEAGRIHDRGTGQLPLNATTSGDVTFDFYPVHAFATFRALFTERQWIVPYIGGGWTRMYYKSRVSGEETREGSVDGRHVRAGVQLLLDPLSRADAANLRRAGIDHSYLILEGQKITAKDDATGLDVGGTTATIGLLLEY
jgi:hypothetical protein